MLKCPFIFFFLLNILASYTPFSLMILGMSVSLIIRVMPFFVNNTCYLLIGLISLY